MAIPIKHDGEVEQICTMEELRSSMPKVLLLNVSQSMWILTFETALMYQDEWAMSETTDIFAIAFVFPNGYKKTTLVGRTKDQSSTLTEFDLYKFDIDPNYTLKSGDDVYVYNYKTNPSNGNEIVGKNILTHILKFV